MGLFINGTEIAETEEVFFNRRNLVFHTDVVEQVLPEYFQRDYPNLIKFIP